MKSETDSIERLPASAGSVSDGCGPCHHPWQSARRNVISVYWPSVLINAVCMVCGGEWVEHYKCIHADEFTASQNTEMSNHLSK